MENNTEQNQSVVSETQSKFSRFFTGLVLLLVAVTAVLMTVVLIANWYHITNSAIQNTQIIATSDTAGWQIFTDPQDGFQLQYPSNWKQLHGGTTQGQIMDIGYNVASATCAEGIGCTYPGEIFVRGVTNENILLPQDTARVSSLEDFAQKYDAAGLDNDGIVSSSTMIDGHQAIEMDAVPGLTGPDATLVSNITFFIQYSQSSVIWIEVNYFPQDRDYVSQVFKHLISTLTFTN
jgi:hypothetical protein